MSGTNYIASNWRVPENSNSSKNDNYSLSFDPADTEYIACGNDPQIQLTGDISISVWFKSSTITPGQPLVSKRNNAFNLYGYQSYINSSGELQFLVTLSGINTYDAVGTTVVTDGQWHHAVFRLKQNDTIDIYLDGQLEATGSVGAETFIESNSDLQIGYQEVGASTYYFDGDISEVALFDYILDTEQISTLRGNATSGSGNPMALKPTPVAYYPLGDNSASNPLTQPNVSVDDASVFTFDGTNYTESSNIPELNGSAVATWSCWIKRANATGGYYTMGTWGNTGTDRQMVLFQSSNLIRVLIGDGTIFDTAFENTMLTADTEWHNIIIVYDGSLGNTSKVKLYYDTTPLTNTATGTNVTTLNTSSNGFTIGALGTGTPGVNWFIGEISNVAVWDTDETDEIPNIYNDGIPATSYTNTPIAWWKLDQSANWEADTSGNWQVPNAVSAYPQSFDFVPNDLILFSSNDSYKLQEFSVSLWFKPDVSAADPIFLNGAYGLGSIGFEIFQYFGGARVRINGSNEIIGSLNIGEWHHIFVSYDGTTVKYSINGAAIQTGTLTGTINYSTYNGIAVGRSVQGYTNGKISNVMFWDSDISASSSLTYNNGTPLTTAIQSANLKGWWKLDDTELFDNTNWSIENQVYPSNYNSALSFNTSESDYIQLPLSTFVYTGEFALSVWVNPTILSNDQVIFGNGSSSNNWLRLSSATQITFKIDSNSQTFTEGSGNNLVVDTWQHLLITRDSSNDVKIYRNGVIFGIATNYTQTLTFSNIGYRGSFYYDGEMSNIVIWNSDQGSEKDNIYNNGTPTNSYTNTPTSWWKLDNLTTGLQDNGSGDNNATNNGTIVVNTYVNTESATSSGMTEQSLVNNNVSTLNGESSGMTSGNLVLSDLTRNLPYENYSLEFDGALEYINCGNVLDQTGSSAFSISTWVKYTSPGSKCILAKANSGQAGYSLFTISSKIYFYLSAGGSNYIEVKTSSSVNDGNWHNITITYDGSGNASGTKIYLDSSLDTTIVTDLFTTSSSNTANLQIGARGSTIDIPFIGKISNTSIFNVELTSTEVLKLYANGMPQDLTNFTPQPASWWTLGKESFWNGSDWIVRDMVDSNDGTSNGMAVSDLVGDAPRSEANGTGTNMDIPTNLVGNAGFSDKNAYSINMSPSARVTDTP